MIYAVFSIYWGRWTLQVLDVSIEKGVGYWIIIVLKKSKFITLYITWERWTLLTSIIAQKGIMKISIILGMIWLLSFSSPEIAEKRESFIIDKFFPLSTNIKIKRYCWKCRLLIRKFITEFKNKLNKVWKIIWLQNSQKYGVLVFTFLFLFETRWSFWFECA